MQIKLYFKWRLEVILLRYPEFREAEYSTTDIPIRKWYSYLIQALMQCLFYSGSLFLILWATSFFFEVVLKEYEAGIYLNAISVGASIVTIFSAIISVLSLIDSDCLKKYEDDLNLLERRYLNGKKISGWEFLKRSSCNKYQNYYVRSACFKLFSADDDSQYLEIVVPALSIDFKDVPCALQIIRLQSFIPQYLYYIESEQNNFLKIQQPQKHQGESPDFFIPLPNHLIAVYKKILIHKLIKKLIVFSFMFVICAIIITVKWLV